MNKLYLRQDCYDEPIARMDEVVQQIHTIVQTPEQLKYYHDLMQLLETAEMSPDVGVVVMALREVRARLGLNWVNKM